MSSKPKLGQNFLNDPSAALAIVDALGELSERTVLEIGPGKGAITQLLARRAKRLIAVELDAELAAQLLERHATLGQVSVVSQDILTVNLEQMVRPGEDKLAVIGNLPYYITSPILLHLFAHHRAIGTAVLMVQREVADRIAAEPGSRDYGLLTATTKLYARVEKLFSLPPAAFTPPPEVHSTVLRLSFSPRFVELDVDPEAFKAFLKQLFAQKRKTLANNLRFAGWSMDEVAKALARLKIAPDIRAEALPLEASASLFRELRRLN